MHQFSVTKQYYKCDYCGSTYESIDDATRCEHSHTYGAVITASFYDAFEVFPNSVEISFDNGQSRLYELA